MRIDKIKAFYKIASSNNIPLKTYIIQSGDTIGHIAKTYYPKYHNTAVKYILKINNLNDADQSSLQIGQKIKIPVSEAVFIKELKLAENEGLRSSAELRTFLKNVEGFISYPKDVEGKGVFTIGWGHKMSNQETLSIKAELKKLNKKGFLKTDPMMSRLLEADILAAEKKVKAAALPALNQAKFDALVSLAFNTGHVPSEVRKLLWNKNILGAASFIKTYKITMPGLVARREREVSLFLKGEY